MESKWLEDFIGLTDAGSFSRAAQLSHMTQSALARRKVLSPVAMMARPSKGRARDHGAFGRWRPVRVA